MKKALALVHQAPAALEPVQNPCAAGNEADAGGLRALPNWPIAWAIGRVVRLASHPKRFLSTHAGILNRVLKKSETP
ncbi:hypothetical protein [Vandammella animalimorsus]|uniref:hypothetical protein n=1 Tax=Vandammella animalimorsus TaxID=2029117 RepID=UPI0011C4690F|nr:hypothetical protein [Vandammella animalimorsus]